MVIELNNVIATERVDFNCNKIKQNRWICWRKSNGDINRCFLCGNVDAEGSFIKVGAFYGINYSGSGITYSFLGSNQQLNGAQVTVDQGDVVLIDFINSADTVFTGANWDVTTIWIIAVNYIPRLRNVASVPSSGPSYENGLIIN